jgi:hypothetical protein
MSFQLPTGTPDAYATLGVQPTAFYLWISSGAVV